MSAEIWSIKRLLQWTQQFLKEKGVESARLEAEILLAHVLGCKRIDLYVRSEEQPADDKRTTFRELIKKRVDGCPVAYLVGQREFFQLNFAVTPAVLIPRPETELLVIEAIRLLKGKESSRVLDIGTGSGCIALSIAKQCPAARITASDKSEQALAIATRNAATHRLGEHVRFVQGDLFVPIGDETFDLIISNPPYIATAEIETLDRDVRDFEPRTALDGGADGLGIYRRLIAETPSHLAPGGSLLLEIGATQESAVHELLKATGRFTEVKTHRDAQKLPRVIEAG